MDHVMNSMRRIVTQILMLMVGFCMLSASICYGASSDAYTIDPVHSSLVFRIKHLGITFFYGRFTDLAGTLKMDRQLPENNSIHVSVNVERIDTFNPERDTHLKSPDFFDAEQFPEISFTSDRFDPIDEDSYQVQGRLTLHGITRPITASVDHTGSGNDPWGGYRTGFEAMFMIKRSEFGMTHMLNGLSDTVWITLSIEAVRQP